LNEGRRKKEEGRRKKQVLRWGFRQGGFVGEASLTNTPPQLKTGEFAVVGVLTRTARIKNFPVSFV
jgi:hypothetical protein